MVKVQSPQICPHCGADQLDLDETGVINPLGKDTCYACFKTIKKPTNQYFESPDYIYHQKNTLIQDLIKNKSNPDSDKYNEKVQEFEIAQSTWFRTCLHEDRVAAMNDAKDVIAELIYSVASKEEASRIIAMAEKIGKYATALKEINKLGVPLYERKVRPVRPLIGDDDWSEAAASKGGDT